MVVRKAVQNAFLGCTALCMKFGLTYEEGIALFRTLGSMHSLLSKDTSDKADEKDAELFETYYEQELQKIKNERKLS